VDEGKRGLEDYAHDVKHVLIAKYSMLFA
jgi:hypothetical protein